MESVQNFLLVLYLISFLFGGLFSFGWVIGHPNPLNKIIPVVLIPSGVVLFGIWFYFVVVLGLGRYL